MKRAAIPALSLAAALALTSCAVQRGEATDATAAAPADYNPTCTAEGNSQGVTDDTITLGNLGPLTGVAADLGLRGRDGLQLAIDQANAEGGIQGRQLKLVVKDDQYDASTAQAAIRELDASEEIFLLAGGVGTPNFVAILPYLKDNGIPAIGPYAPSNQVGVMENPNVYMIWPSFTDEFQVGLRWLVENETPESIALVRMEGDVGDDGLKGMELALEGTDLKVDPIETVEATTTNFTSIAQSLKNSGSDVVAMISPAGNIGQLIEAMHAINYYPRFLGQSDMNDQSFLDPFGEAAEGMTITTKVTPLNSDQPEMQQFIAAFEEAYGEKPSMWNQIGYTSGLVTLEALRQAPKLTRECVEETLQGMEGFETGFIPPVTFSAKSRQGTSAVGVARIESSQITELSPFAPVNREK
ncbi:MAG: ABC transporter substrate-binding protein [Georgenia sp.]